METKKFIGKGWLMTVNEKGEWDYVEKFFVGGGSCKGEPDMIAKHVVDGRLQLELPLYEVRPKMDSWVMSHLYMEGKDGDSFTMLNLQNNMHKSSKLNRGDVALQYDVEIKHQPSRASQKVWFERLRVIITKA